MGFDLCSFMLRMVCEAPVLEDTLMRVMLIGLTRELPLTANDCMDIVDQLVKRAAGLYYEGNSSFPLLLVIFMSRLLFLKVTEYRIFRLMLASLHCLFLFSILSMPVQDLMCAYISLVIHEVFHGHE